MAEHLPYTQLLHIDLGINGYDKSIDYPCCSTRVGAYRNFKTKLLTPYYTLALKLLPKENVPCNVGVEALTSIEGCLRYAGGIFRHLPFDVQKMIFSYFPLMCSTKGGTQTDKYLKMLRQRHPNGLQCNEPEPMVEGDDDEPLPQNKKKCIVM